MVRAGKEVEELLSKFSEPANRTQLHLFRDVIRASHRSDPTFSGPDLKDWLTNENWPAEAIVDLVKRFEDGRLLLGGQ